MANTFRNIRDGGNLIVADVSALPATAPTGTLAVDASTTDVYVFDGTSWQLKTASGSAGVSTFNGRSGVVVSVAGDYTASEITNVPTAPITATNVQDALDELATMGVTFPLNAGILGSNTSPVYQMVDNDSGMYSEGDGNVSFSANGFQRLSINQNSSQFIGDLDITGNLTAANYPPTGNNNTFAGFDSSGDLFSVPGFNIDTTSGGMNEILTEVPNGNVSGYSVNISETNFDPAQNSPDENWLILNRYINLDVNSSGFTQGTNGNAITLLNQNISHQGTGDVGGLTFINNSLNLGNGTDPINIKGFSYAYGFGAVNANVNINGPIQGYGFQPSLNAASTIDSSVYLNAFYDYANLPVAVPSYNSFIAGPTISSIANNSNYTGYSNNPTITTLTGNAGYTGLGIFPNITTVNSGGVNGISINPTIGTIVSGGFNGININPNISLNNNYVVGLDINMNNVTNYAGAQASLVVQDITYVVNEPGSANNSITVEYTNTTTAGNEVATFSFPNIVVSIESGVSTATQVLAAINAVPSLISNATITITGTPSNPQVTYPQTNLAGGINPGTKKAANFVGDVSIDGALSFTGGLSIGALSSFAAVDISAYPSGVNSIDTLITAPSIADNTTINTDILAVNTAMLLTLGDNVTATSSFLGYTALGLPAVLAMGTGSTIDRVTGATFALSLDSGAGGGTVDEVDLCRALAIPNGVTTVNKLYGYKMDLPFGDPGTTSWGFYESPGVHNYMQGDLLVGGTAGSVDTVVNSSVGIELNSTTKAILNARMTTTEKNALTAVAGMMVYDTTLNQLSYYNGSTWVNI